MVIDVGGLGGGEWHRRSAIKPPGVKSLTIHFMRSLRWFAGALSGAVALACLAQAAPKKGKVEVKKTAFGKTSDGMPVELYTLSNVNGMTVGIMTYGGTVVSLTAPDRHGTVRRRGAGHGQRGRIPEARPPSSARSSAATATASATRSSTWTARLTSCPRTTARTRCTAARRASTSTSGRPGPAAGRGDRADLRQQGRRRRLSREPRPPG